MSINELIKGINHGETDSLRVLLYERFSAVNNKLVNWIPLCCTVAYIDSIAEYETKITKYFTKYNSNLTFSAFGI